MKENKSLKDIINHRVEKLEKIKESNFESFPYSFKSNIKINEIFEKYDSLNDSNIKISGRMISLRKLGKAGFIHLQDDSGKIQIYVRTDNLEDGIYDEIVRNLDIGDIIGVFGTLFYTKTEELSLKVTNLIILSKNITPLPNLKEKDGKTFFSYNDKELRYRNRHLDLITNPDVKKSFLIRAQVIKVIWSF